MQHLGNDGEKVPEVHAFAVCDNENYFVEKGRQDVMAWYQRYAPDQSVRIPELKINDAYIGEGYGLASKAVFKTIETANFGIANFPSSSMV